MRCGLECSGHRLINGKEFAQLDYPTLLMKLADHGGSFEVERCEQVDRAVAQIVRRAPLGLAATHRQHWLAGVCRKCCIREPYNEAWLGREEKVWQRTGRVESRMRWSISCWRAPPGDGYGE